MTISVRMLLAIVVVLLIILVFWPPSVPMPSDRRLVDGAIVLFIIAALPHKIPIRFEWLAFACLAATLL